ncbi:MAG TPA: hypothetical protein VLE99_01380 [Candidatus Saccharimonadales bacterium]|nr:hypothetical protein [Candidatus Saccharimonadales bacterium]
MNCKPFLVAHARKLDLRLYEHLFEKASAQPVLDELVTYQNADGGFGHSLELDLGLPDSSVLATTIAFQYILQIGVDTKETTSKAIAYLLQAYDKSRHGWVNIPPAANDYPRAPWWNYPEVLSWADWGNPSAEILGYLLRYADEASNHDLLAEITEQAINRLHAIDEPEPHEIKCYARLYKQANPPLQARLYDQLARCIRQAAKTSPKDWQGYIATPLTFIDAPDDPFADLFSKDLLLENAHYIRGQLLDGDHWEPNWEWGQFEADWAKAKWAWSGKLTVDNLKLLHSFGVTS